MLDGYEGLLHWQDMTIGRSDKIGVAWSVVTGQDTHDFGPWI
jgi:hypothetical protein